LRIEYEAVEIKAMLKVIQEAAGMDQGMKNYIGERVKVRQEIDEKGIQEIGRECELLEKAPKREDYEAIVERAVTGAKERIRMRQ
jgi:tRNA threonylcarbamoyladenosine modification (KEOPS) complex Cgi121 subunit